MNELYTAVSHEKRTWIESILSDIERHIHIRIIFCSESGFRAKGCYSPDSNLEIRALYINTKEKTPRNVQIPFLGKAVITEGVIGLFLEGIHISMWDITKALTLENKVIHWLHSPIVYRDISPVWTCKMKLFVKQGIEGHEACRRDSLNMLESQLKLDIRVLNITQAMSLILPTLRLAWLDDHPFYSPPPVWCLKALEECDSISDNVRSMVKRIVTRKRHINEHKWDSIDQNLLIYWAHTTKSSHDSYPLKSSHRSSITSRNQLFLEAYHLTQMIPN